MRFTDAYVMPQCTPTRAALLTGQHTARNGMWHVIGWYGSPWARMTEPAFVENLYPEMLSSSPVATGWLPNRDGGEVASDQQRCRVTTSSSRTGCR